MSELKFVITGTAGVGNTTAIAAFSDIPPIETDALTTDELSEIKSSTTVAFDFGEVILDEDIRLRIYGTPGQSRFQHMWEILADGALGLVILVDSTRPDPIEDMRIYLDNFAHLIAKTGVVIGVTRTGLSGQDNLDLYFEALETKNIYCPVMKADPRSRKDMAELMDVLMTCLEYA